MQRGDSAPGVAKPVTPSGRYVVNLDSHGCDLDLDSAFSAIMHAAYGKPRVPTGHRKS